MQPCDEPLDEEEVRKVAEEMARFGSGNRDDMIKVMEELGCPEARSKLSVSGDTEPDLEEELYHLLSECLEDSDTQSGATGPEHHNGSSQPSATGSHPRSAFRKKLAGKLKASHSPQLELIANG